MVSGIVTREVSAWATDHPEVASQLTELRTFSFPDLWSSES
jgi:hypothetical protein